MNSAQLRDVAITGVAFALLNQLWLFGGNSLRLAEQHRGLVKAIAMLLAVMFFVMAVVRTARGHNLEWLKPTVGVALASVGLGFALILAAGALWNRGQFFHDGVRVPQLAILVVGALLAAAFSAGAIGALVRSFGGLSTR